MEQPLRLRPPQTQLLARLPGLGPRSARRAALHLIKKREPLMAPLAAALQTAIEKIGKDRSAINAYYLAAVHSAAGDADLALEALEKSLDLGFRDFLVLQPSPDFEPLRTDPRFQELVDRYRG